MNIIMAGIDYSLASLQQREQFALTQSRQRQLLCWIKDQPGILGAVLLCTCNRTELYLSYFPDTAPDPVEMLCGQLHIREQTARPLFRVRQGEKEVFFHLGRLSCGAKSQIWGEDQIITQVKNALALSREEKAADSVLEVLFRSAVTAAKRIKTEIVFSHGDHSVASKAVTLLECQQPRPQKVLVIGNGEIGRLTAQSLLEQGFSVGMTLRQYKYAQVQLPQGVEAFDYSQRYERMSLFDAVVSATLSPHFTVEAGPFLQISSPPRLLVDLAVPRDLDPELRNIPDIHLWDIDQLGKGQAEEQHSRQLEQIDRILEQHLQDFLHWKAYKERAALCTNVM